MGKSVTETDPDTAASVRRGMAEETRTQADRTDFPPGPPVPAHRQRTGVLLVRFGIDAGPLLTDRPDIFGRHDSHRGEHPGLDLGHRCVPPPLSVPVGCEWTGPVRCRADRPEVVRGTAGDTPDPLIEVGGLPLPVP